MTEEVWKDVVGYEGSYMVSDLGRVKSLDRAVRGGHGQIHARKGQILTLAPAKSNARITNLSKGGVNKPHRVARLVLQAFRGPSPPGMVACHKSHDSTDNSLANLHWLTLRKNYESLGSRSAHPSRPVLRDDGLEFRSASEAGRVLEIPVSGIATACRRGWRCCGHYWKFKEAEDSK